MKEETFLLLENYSLGVAFISIWLLFLNEHFLEFFLFCFSLFLALYFILSEVRILNFPQEEEESEIGEDEQDSPRCS